MTAVPRMRILDPTVAPSPEPAPLAPRLDSLDGKVIGLYSNGKLNATRFLEIVGEELLERYPIQEVARGKFNAGRILRREEWEAIENCDAIILGIGD